MFKKRYDSLSVIDVNNNVDLYKRNGTNLSIAAGNACSMMNTISRS